MHDAIFESQDQWSGSPGAVETFKRLAGDLGLNQSQFDACLDGGTYADRVAADYQEGVAEGVTGTPAFRINGVALSGAQPFAAFQEQIDYFAAGGEAPSLEVSADSYRSLGDADASVVVTEFSDYQCPACAQIEALLVPALIEQYVDTGKVRFVYRHFPLDAGHPNARGAAEAAACAGQQDEFWAMHDRIFAGQSDWANESDPSAVLGSYAEEIGLDAETFNDCLEAGEAATEVQSDFLAGQTLGVNATPYFFVNDLPVRGGKPIEIMGQIIDYVAAGGEIPEIVPTGDDWRLQGDRQTARAATVVFVDYASPDSAEFAQEVLPKLVEEYVDSGKLVYILHPWATEADSPGALAATAAECAGQEGLYWDMHHQILEEQDSWLNAEEPEALFSEYADSLGLDAVVFAECLASEWAALRVLSGNVVGAMYGVPTAPVFLFSNGQVLEGSPTLEEFKTILDSMVGP
jgi:protein-disulfide isomerase